MCHKSLKLHSQTNKVDYRRKTEVKTKPVKIKVKQLKPNEAELFFLKNEQVLF